MDNKAFARNLEKRTRRFAVEIIRLSSSLPNTPEARVIRNQLTKAGTSIGANYREANRSRSRADFRSRIKICTSEASEAMYWMEVIMKVGWMDGKRGKPLYSECNELLSIFSAVVRSSNS
jgi:four helix bundle protein